MQRGRTRATIKGVPINPRLPAKFGVTPNDARPASHQRWWDRPYIETYVDDDPRWSEWWPEGVRYDVRCLDGGAWDRPTCWGMFGTLDEALACAHSGPSWRRPLGPLER